MIGVGVDVVDVDQFGQQVDTPGSRFYQVFTDAEWAYANRQPGPARLQCLAARWAAKEAAIKAWSSLLVGTPPVIDPAEVVWSDIEVTHDAWGRPILRFHGRIAQLIDSDWVWAVSISHDGPVAFAQVLVYGS